jgi:hypothetical protein
MDTETYLADARAPNYRATFAYLCSQLPPPPDDMPDEARAAGQRSAMDAACHRA